MLRAMVTFLLENGRIETTVTRAKDVRAMAEKMITIAKKDTLHTRRLVMAFITKEDVANKLFTEIAPQYQDRNGGYTRITKIGPRRGDAAPMAIIELMETAAKPVAEAAPAAKAEEKPAEKAEAKADDKAEKKADEKADK
jgi:large subunit ribosomal protein L17